jgi:hypothetical protein
VHCAVDDDGWLDALAGAAPEMDTCNGVALERATRGYNL